MIQSIMRRPSPMPLLLLLLVLPGLLACDETAVFLVFHSRLKIPAQLDALCVQIGAGGRTQFGRRYPLTEADAGKPHTLSVAAGSEYDDRFEVMLGGQRRGWETAWMRQDVAFEAHQITQLDLHVESCQGLAGSGQFQNGGKLVAAAGSTVACLPVPWAWDQAVVAAPGEARRFALLSGQVQQKPDGLPKPGSSAPTRLLAADLDGDCAKDLLVLTASGAQVWKNDGSGGFTQAASALPSGLVYTAAAAADLNQDQVMDLVLAGTSGLALLLGRADAPGQFRALSGQLPTSGLDRATDVAIGFFNNDAHPDLLVGRGGTTAEANLLLLNSSSGTAVFSAGPAFLLKDPTSSVAAADLDGDGLHEAVVGNAGQASLVYSNQRGVLDQKAPITLAGTQTGQVLRILARDLDNDCAVDLVLCRKEGVKVLLNLGKGSFQAVDPPGSTGLSCTDLDAGDLDGDGLLDLVLGGGSGGAVWLKQKL